MALWLLLLGTAGAALPPPAVVVSTVEVRPAAPAQTFVGHVQAIQSVEVTARVQAYIERVDFDRGSMVKAGQVLFELEKAPFQAALEAAQGNLRHAEAVLRNAAIVYGRDQKLPSGSVISQAKVDQDLATRDADAADVLSARASLDTAQINLGYTTITAPIDGRIGNAAFTRGNLVSPSSGALARLAQMDPVWALFGVPDGELVSAMRDAGQGGGGHGGGLGKRFVLNLRLADGSRYAEAGYVDVVDNHVDQSTGTASVWGRFPNGGHLLLPGAFVTVEMRPATAEQRPMVPLAALQNDRSGPFVLLVDAANTVRQQRITTGRQIGESQVVTAGLKGGERVIVQGIQNVRPGETVQPTAAPAQAAAAAD